VINSQDTATVSAADRVMTYLAWNQDNWLPWLAASKSRQETFLRD